MTCSKLALLCVSYQEKKDSRDDVSDAGEDDEGVTPGDVVVVRVQQPVAVPAHAAEDAEREKEQNS